MGEGAQAALTANAGNRALWFPLGDGAGTVLREESGRIGTPTVAGTTAGLWAAPSGGITLTTDNHVLLNSASLTAEQSAFVESIYDNPSGIYSGILYCGFQLGISGTPAGDLNNFIFSFGSRDDAGAHLTGQLGMRLPVNRRPEWMLRTRETVSTNYFGASPAGAQIPTSGVQQTVFSFILPSPDGTTPPTSNVAWYFNGVALASATLAEIHDKGPISDPVAGGVCVFGRQTAIPPYASTANIGAGTVAPTMRNLLIGRCSFTPENVVLLQRLATHMHYRRALPAWFSQIT